MVCDVVGERNDPPRPDETWWFLYNPYVCWRQRCLLWRDDSDPTGATHRCFNPDHPVGHICGHVEERWGPYQHQWHYGYRCPSCWVPEMGQVVCAMTGYVLDDQAEYQPLYPSDYTAPVKQRKKGKRGRVSYRVAADLGDCCGGRNEQDLWKDPNDRYVCILLYGEKYELVAELTRNLWDPYLSREDAYAFYAFFLACAMPTGPGGGACSKRGSVTRS